MTDAPTRFGFVCVQNAGRSQMSAAFAERERRRRGLDGQLEILTGGTDPADAVHDEVVAAMEEVGIDLSGREPRAVSTAELNDCTVVATMGCSTLDLDADVDIRDWALRDPHGEDPETVRAIRDEVQGHVEALFDEFFARE